MKLGQFPESNDTRRDAVHVAIAPVVAGEELRPGQHVGIVDGKAVLSGETLGIVDPYLRVMVAAGQPFYLCLYPDTITSLRHEWSHPAFDADKLDAETWLREFCSQYGAKYDDLLASVAKGEGYCFVGSSSGPYETQKPDFARNVGILLGRPIDVDQPFHCGC